MENDMVPTKNDNLVKMQWVQKRLWLQYDIAFTCLCELNRRAQLFINDNPRQLPKR